MTKRHFHSSHHYLRRAFSKSFVFALSHMDGDKDVFLIENILVVLKKQPGKSVFFFSPEYLWSCSESLGINKSHSQRSPADHPGHPRGDCLLSVFTLNTTRGSEDLCLPLLKDRVRAKKREERKGHESLFFLQLVKLMISFGANKTTRSQGASLATQGPFRHFSQTPSVCSGLVKESRSLWTCQDTRL